MIRTVARCLVDYENIGNSLQWVEAQVPEVIRNYVEKMLNSNMRRGAEQPWWTSIVDVQLLSQVCRGKLVAAWTWSAVMATGPSTSKASPTAFLTTGPAVPTAGPRRS